MNLKSMAHLTSASLNLSNLLAGDNRTVVLRAFIRFGLMLAGMSSLSHHVCAEDIVYPSTFQVLKDGTAVALEDYATLPHTGRGGSISDFGPHAVFNNQLSRANFLRSEPEDAPRSSSRFTVIGMETVLPMDSYIAAL